MELTSDDGGTPLNESRHTQPSRSRGLGVRLATVAVVILIGSASQSPAQSLGRTEKLTRQQKVDLIAHVLADVQADFPSPDQALSLEVAVVQEQLAVSTTKIMDLRDALSDNKYITIRTFSIDLPSGVSVQFDFPPEDRGE